MTILVDHLSLIYHAGTPLERVALRDVSLRVDDGSCAAIVGVTGSGKSTLAQCLNGLLTPTGGRVVVDDLELTPRGLSGRDLRELRRRVGLLFQFPEGQLFAPTIGEDVAYGPSRLKLKRQEIAERTRWALRAVALPDDDAFMARSPFALSGGQRRRVALAGVLAMRPRIVVLDEPSAGLDAEAREEIYATLRELRARERLTLIVISHDMSEVAALAETALALRDGEAALSGPTEAVFRQTEAIEAAGLLAPPLAQVATLARAQGLLRAEPTSLTAEALADALTRSSRRDTRSTAASDQCGTQGGYHAG
ncbi:MAG TPA: ATP-binding cassette domain-containing protein [Ktedonobacterales bacterium]|jgi:energy-coupling factor transport system ATP-binding protein|nr:ATP-binding cassette domain-containing protein [Ktedonobacterales bacterium]